MGERILLGMLTPSSNTALEPITTAMLAGIPEASAHFGRFRVQRIALSEDALAQFDLERMLAAAELLADARVDVIAWNGTSAGWLGLDTDRRLCAAVSERLGVPATSSSLALEAAFAALGVRSCGLVSPYTADVQAAIERNFAAEGFPVAAERHLEIADNFAFSEVPAAELDRMVAEVAASRGVEAITTFCTNLKAAPLVAGWEARHGLPVLDSISVVVWHALRLAGVDPGRIVGWGRLFAGGG